MIISEHGRLDNGPLFVDAIITMLKLNRKIILQMLYYVHLAIQRRTSSRRLLSNKIKR